MPYAVRRLADTAEVWSGVRCRWTRDLGETVKNEEQEEMEKWLSETNKNNSTQQSG